MNQTDEMERCVYCGKITAFERSVPISARRFYIEGCGQLCEQCYLEIKYGAPWLQKAAKQ